MSVGCLFPTSHTLLCGWFRSRSASDSRSAARMLPRAPAHTERRSRHAMASVAMASVVDAPRKKTPSLGMQPDLFRAVMAAVRVFVLVCLGASSIAAQQQVDVLIRGGTVVDGT